MPMAERVEEISENIWRIGKKGLTLQKGFAAFHMSAREGAGFGRS